MKKFFLIEMLIIISSFFYGLIFVIHLKHLKILKVIKSKSFHDFEKIGSASLNDIGNKSPDKNFWPKGVIFGFLRLFLALSVIVGHSESRVDVMTRDFERYMPSISKAKYIDSLFEIKTVLVKNEVDDGRPILFEKASRIGWLLLYIGWKN